MKRNSASGSRPAGGNGCKSPRTSPTDCTPSASAPATSPRSWRTRCRNGCMPIWASSAPAAFRPESIRPIHRPRSNISSTIPAPGSIFAEDEEQLDKLLTCRARCPTLEKIIVFDMEGLSGFIDPMVLSLAEFMALGRNHSQDNEALWEEMIGSRSASTISRSWSTPRAQQGRPRARCIPTAASPTRCATPTICFPRAMPRSGWCSCRSAMSPSGSAATTPRSRWGR